jgi:hypothetical protein
MPEGINNNEFTQMDGLVNVGLTNLSPERVIELVNKSELNTGQIVDRQQRLTIEIEIARRKVEETGRQYRGRDYFEEMSGVSDGDKDSRKKRVRSGQYDVTPYTSGSKNNKSVTGSKVDSKIVKTMFNKNPIELLRFLGDHPDKAINEYGMPLRGKALEDFKKEVTENAIKKQGYNPNSGITDYYEQSSSQSSNTIIDQELQYYNELTQGELTEKELGRYIKDMKGL